ncbi:hypothetical protein E3V55_02110 [Candidatus Marinimicrobia bacterium MT.SAG.3]|nr:hypothetical protein E3V55_02110 [Candidatus Marinimicrobia bacterium MT.SAG.3]
MKESKIEYEELMSGIDESLDNYIGEVSPNFKATIEDIRQNNERVLSQLLKTYYLSSMLVDDFDFPSDEVYQGIKVLFSKAGFSTLGIYSCLSNGVITEASSLLRTLFETKVNIHLLLQDDTLNRLSLYNNFKTITKHNHLQSYEKKMADGELSEESFEAFFHDIDIQSLKDSYESIKDDYHPTYPANHWAWKIYKDERNQPPNMRFICDKLGLSDDYRKIFGLHSSTIHSNPIIENMMTHDGNLSIVPFNSENILRLACISLDISWKSIVSVISYFDENYGEGLSKYSDYVFVQGCVEF